MEDAGHPQTVLIVDDDEGMALLIEEAMRCDGSYTVIILPGEQAIAWLKDHHADLMLLDLKLSDLHGKELLDRLEAEAVGSAVPFIVITGQGDERVAVDMMKRGALDYVVKNGQFVDFLPIVVRRSLAQLEKERQLGVAEAERKRLEQEILEISEREQRRIGEDLHDGLYQVLSSIVMRAEMLQQSLARSFASEAVVASTISGQAQEAIKLARLLVRGLSQVDVEANGIVQALKEMAEYTATHRGVACEFHCNEPVLIESPAKATHLYRIAQEAINNAITHGKAKRIDVVLSRKAERGELKITDDGVGFQPESKGADGMGLRNMNYRAGAIGGRVEIHYVSPRGTEVICTFAPS